MKFFLFIIALFCIPYSANAAVLITSVEYGNPGANDELIVVTNDGSDAVNIGTWSIQAKNNSSNTMQKKNFIAGTIIEPGSSYVVANKDGRFAAQAHMTYTSLSLANTGGTVAIVKNATYLTSFDDPAIAHAVPYGPLTSTTTSATDQSTQSNTTTSTESITKSVSSVEEFIGIIPTTKESWPVIISELLPKPISDDEYIEIQNTSTSAVDVSGLWFTDAAGSRYALGSRGENTLLGAGEFRAWKRSLTRIALNDTDGEVVSLQSQSGMVVDRISYTTDAIAGAGYARFGKSLLWTISPTRSDKNYFTAVQAPPIARAVIPYSTIKTGEIISVSAEDSTDPNDSIQSYLWDFGDGATYTAVTTTHAFTSAGVYPITLTITDSFGATSSVSRDVQVIASNPLRISAAGFISAAAVSAATTTPKKTTNTKSKAVAANPQFSGTVSIPPGILGKRKFVVNGRTVEVTSDRKELPRLQSGTVISFTAQEILRSERLILQITVKDPITVTALATPPPYDVLTGEVSAVSKTGFDLSTTSTDYVVLAGTRYENGEKIKVGDIVRAEGVLLRDDSIEQTFVIPYANKLHYLDTSIKKVTTKSQLGVLGISVGALIGLQLFTSLAVPRIRKYVAIKMKNKNHGT